MAMDIHPFSTGKYVPEPNLHSGTGTGSKNGTITAPEQSDDVIETAHYENPDPQKKWREK